MNDIELLKKMIDESNNIVFFGGAGVSTDSGIPDFRSSDGLYSRKNEYNFPPEYMLSSSCFYNNTDIFYEYYKKNMNCLNYQPNITHKYLKKLEDEGKLKAIITQNIDGLHEKAGSKNVYELHGTVNENKCLKCGKIYDAKYVFGSNGIPKCKCGWVLKPNVVLYGEQLPDDAYNGAIDAILNADMLIVAGTSLTVYPASGLVGLFNKDKLVIINKDKTPYDNNAALVIHERLKDVFEKL